MDYETQRHPCVWGDCSNTVAFDDEPYCFTHSPDSGSSVKGYSYRARQQRQDAVRHDNRKVDTLRPWGKAF